MRDKILAVATAEIGYTEKPGNDNKYGTWFGFPNVHWCAQFVSWCYAQAGHYIKGGGWPKGFAGVPYYIEYARRNNLLTTTPQPGDIVCFDWNGDKRADHTGLFVRDLGGGFIETIEGNTSAGDAGSQSNGDGVYRRKRNKKFVQCYINALGDAATLPLSATTTYKKGDKGEAVKRIQEKLNNWTVLHSKGTSLVEVDGHYGQKTADRVAMYQFAKKLAIDGICGPKTLKALGL
jgi:hypothetical protein